MSIVNELGQLLFDSIVQPQKTVKYVPLYNMYLYDPSFGIPLKYMSEMLNQIFDKRVIVGYQLSKLLKVLNLTSVYTVRDIVSNDTIGINCPSNLAKTFFDASLDPFFRSTISEARLYMALYKSFQNEIDDTYLRYAIADECGIMSQGAALLEEV